MKIAITGASGFIGKKLCDFFQRNNHTPVALSRSMLASPEGLISTLEGTDIVINLAGASISKRWTSKYKQEIMDSRVLTTRRLVTALNQMAAPPSLCISVSAVGIYPDSGVHGESSPMRGTGFLTHVCESWEQEARMLKPEIRLVITRFGVVLGKEGGAAPLMLVPFRFFAGSIIGNGRQGMPWIHIDDLANAIQWLIEQKQVSGVVNFVSPQLTNNEQFSKTAAKVMHRPCWFRIPTFVFQIILGEGHTMVTSGQQVVSDVLFHSGFKFRYPKLEDAIRSIIS
ncbi:TIGR01777 family oxidoreductase [Macellibacteroides fermentans]|uniref:TIGR01777 family oxidoreductase n=1 Tax=Macellibacteroides fermentans TaxID=879969 RepID=UPI002B39A099|nr:TIGR01777 family oxidoreductase [Macellibacteroides fermentans]